MSVEQYYGLYLLHKNKYSHKKAKILRLNMPIGYIAEIAA